MFASVHDVAAVEQAVGDEPRKAMIVALPQSILETVPAQRGRGRPADVDERKRSHDGSRQIDDRAARDGARRADAFEDPPHAASRQRLGPDESGRVRGQRTLLRKRNRDLPRVLEWTRERNEMPLHAL